MAARLQREYVILQRSKLDHIAVHPDPKSILTWHYVLFNLPDDTPYFGGVYLGKLVFPANYPYAPPAIYMITPNGRFLTNQRLCLSMSDFHPEAWNPAWRVETILAGLLSFMTDVNEPVANGTVKFPYNQRRKFALDSLTHNRNSKVFRDLFRDFADPVLVGEKWVDLYGYHTSNPEHSAPLLDNLQQNTNNPSESWLNRVTTDVKKWFVGIPKPSFQLDTDEENGEADGVESGAETVATNSTQKQ
eukprot:Platyproteum_vivax@DN1459_c0_g1_i1.p1